jgi:hypothetical protein
MTPDNKLTRVGLPIMLTLSLAFATPALAASVATEQQQRAHILNQVKHGTLKPSTLRSGPYENLGEYLMGQLLGSTQLHQRMNMPMDEMMGPTAAAQMHTYLGPRYPGVNPTPSSRYAPLYGPAGVMMSGYRGSPLAGMMSRYLTGQAATGQYGTGPGMMRYPYWSTGSSGVGAGAIIAIILGSVALLSLAVLGATRLARRPPRPAQPHGTSAD